MDEIKLKDTIEWSTPEYVPKEHSKDWYIAVILITLSVIVAAVMYENYFFALFLAIGTSLLLYMAKRPPEIVDVKLSSRGILFHNKMYPYLELDAFWVETRFREPRIIIRQNSKSATHLIVPIAEADPEQVRHFLGYYLDEELQEESIFEHLFHILGF